MFKRVCRLLSLQVLIIVAFSPVVVWSDVPAEKDFASFRKKQLGDLEKRLVEIPASTANDPLIAAARGASQDVDAIVGEVTDSLDRVRSRVVGSMVGNAIGASSKKPHAATPASQADQIRDLYVKYQERLAKDMAVASGNSQQAQMVREYIDATMAAAEKFILLRAGEVEAIGGGDCCAEWATLVPLLRHPDAAWTKNALNALPDWMKKMQSLKAAEHVCLCSARPKAGYCLWTYQVFGDQESKLGLDSYMANLHRRANAYFGSKDLLKGIAVLKAAVVLANSEGMADEAVKTHFRLAEVYTMYGHNQLAADEMKLVMTSHPGHKEHGRAALTRLRYLYESGLFDKLLEEAPTILEDKAAADYRPQIIYIAWVANRRQNKQPAADALQERLIRDYPEHPLCADMYFSSAMNLLAAGDYTGASRLLDMISERYDKTPIAAKAREIRKRMQDAASATPASGPALRGN